MRFKIDPSAIDRINLDPDLANHEFELVEKPTIGESLYVEKVSKTKFDDWSTLMHSACIMFVSIRRADPKWMKSFTWAMAAELSLSDMIDVEEPGQVEPEGDTEGEASPFGESPSGSDETA